jgi:hypothetical protein
VKHLFVNDPPIPTAIERHVDMACSYIHLVFEAVKALRYLCAMFLCAVAPMMRFVGVPQRATNWVNRTVADLSLNIDTVLLTRVTMTMESYMQLYPTYTART